MDRLIFRATITSHGTYTVTDPEELAYIHDIGIDEYIHQLDDHSIFEVSDSFVEVDEVELSVNGTWMKNVDDNIPFIYDEDGNVIPNPITEKYNKTS